MREVVVFSHLTSIYPFFNLISIVVMFSPTLGLT